MLVITNLKKMEKVINIICSKCGKKQKTSVRTEKIIGKTRTCVYCYKRFTISKDNFGGYEK